MAGGLVADGLFPIVQIDIVRAQIITKSSDTDFQGN